MYRKWFEEGLEPTEKTFLYHDDNEINSLVIKIMDVNTEISPKWKEHYEGHIATREDLFKEEVESTLSYLQLRKIKRLMAQNQQDFEKSTDHNEQIMYMQTHQVLKKLELEITKKVGTVIYK
jgi:DNA primase